MQTKETGMKYALLVYAADSTWQDMPDALRDRVWKEFLAATTRDDITAAIRLQPTTTASTVRIVDEERLVTDGPFIESKEYLGGVYVLEAENLDVALAVAAQLPAARYGGAVEVRPLREV
jgi:hypothetical protein